MVHSGFNADPKPAKVLCSGKKSVLFSRGGNGFTAMICLRLILKKINIYAVKFEIIPNIIRKCRLALLSRKHRETRTKSQRETNNKPLQKNIISVQNMPSNVTPEGQMHGTTAHRQGPCGCTHSRARESGTAPCWPHRPPHPPRPHSPTQHVLFRRARGNSPRSVRCQSPPPWGTKEHEEGGRKWVTGRLTYMTYLTLW